GETLTRRFEGNCLIARTPNLKIRTLRRLRSLRLCAELIPEPDYSQGFLDAQLAHTRGRVPRVIAVRAEALDLLVIETRGNGAVEPQVKLRLVIGLPGILQSPKFPRCGRRRGRGE